MNQQLKRTLLSLAGLAVFLLLAFGSEYSTNTNTSSSNRPSRSSRSTNRDTTTYTNSKSDFSGKLEENYVDFSFDYPNAWKRDPEAGKGTSPNFVKVEKTTSDKITLENFAVGYFSGQKALMPQLAAQLSEQFSGGFPEYKKVSEGETRVGSYDGYEFRFTSRAKDTPKGDLDIWGRVVLIPGESGGKGAAMVMLVTSASQDVHSLEDVGEKGELPIILNSFKLGS